MRTLQMLPAPSEEGVPGGAQVRRLFGPDASEGPAPGKRAAVMVISGDDALRRELAGLLEPAGYALTACVSRGEALGLARQGLVDQAGLDLVVFDATGGLEPADLDTLAKRRAAGWPTAALVLGPRPTVQEMVAMMRAGVEDFVELPLVPGELLSRVGALVAGAQRRRHHGAHKPSTVLAIGAHPDDVEIGAGGTLAAHAARGDQVHVVTLTRGSRGGDGQVRAKEAKLAAEALGARLWLEDFEDTELDADGPTVRCIERHVRRLQPDVVYTHSVHDNHQDHRSAHRAAVVAARQVPRVYCFESPSATVAFAPTRFVPIDSFVEGKLHAIEAYDSQVAVRAYLAESRIRAAAHYWSRHIDGEYAEPFETVREVGDLEIQGPSWQTPQDGGGIFEASA